MNASLGRLWVLGADDREMAEIETILWNAGESCVYAYALDGTRVHPGNAYAARGTEEIEYPPNEPRSRNPFERMKTRVGDHNFFFLPRLARVSPRKDCSPILDNFSAVYFVECAPPWPATGGRKTGILGPIDHHHPGDPGYGVPPTDFLRASSIGQVVAELARLGRVPRGSHPFPREWLHSSREELRLSTAVGHGDAPLIPGALQFRLGESGRYEWHVAVDDRTLARVPGELVYVAAADHCLGAAYRGRCPGVDPEELAEWRVAGRATHQGRSGEEVEADVERAKKRLKEAEGAGRVVWIGRGLVIDMRGVEIPELPEAAAQIGRAFLATPRTRPGSADRQKVVLQVASPEILAAWPEWAAKNGIVGLYGGDPMRGFAGGYLP